MNARNASREWRRRNARRNAIANEIAGFVASGRTPDPEIVARWEQATIRLQTIPPKTRKETQT